LLPVLRLGLALFCTFAAVSVAPARADDADSAAVAALGSARTGDWAKAYLQAGQSKDPLAMKLVRWLDYTRGSPGGRFAEIAAFIDQNPDWPLQKTLRKRAEAALAGEPDDTAAAWFQRSPPISGPGKARAAELTIRRGNIEAGTAALRSAWIEEDFGPGDERNLLARFGATLRTEDHQKRLDHLLWDGQADAAKRMLPMVSADQRTLAEARLALASDAKDASKLAEKVPEQLRSDPGFVFDLARWWRKHDKFDTAAQLLLGQAANSSQPSAFWAERVTVVRRLVGMGNHDLAYQLVAQQAPPDDKNYGEAEFLAGYVALRFRKDPSQAFDHFARILARVNSPYAKARAAYWGGRAAQAVGKADLANKWYAAGSEHMATFYGQLSAHQLGRDAPPKPIPEPRPSHAEQAQFDAKEMVQAARLFLAAGDRDRARTFLMQLADQAKTPLDFAMLAALAESSGRIDLAIGVARRSIEAGLPLMVHGYPVTAVPNGGTAEKPLLMAIVRQESNFALDAMSPVGARGLMQLMPGTAAGVAGKLQLPFSLARLTTDGVYNIMLGRSYVETMIDDFGGSYPLAIAAYNAGPGRVRQWLREFGDPRGHDLNMVDWIEMIPFNETRIYVQRVLENLQIYRGQSGDSATAFSLVGDLAR
jgi:soluble lytic murein transglycosylase